MSVDNSLSLICSKHQGVKRIGFSSEEFKQISCEDDDFKTVLNTNAINKIKNEIEGRCIGDGYIIPGTVKLLERSNISFPHEALQLFYSMHIKYEYSLCNPNPGVILNCSVMTKNKIGILGKLTDKKSPLVILIPKDLCDTPQKIEILENSNISDIIKVTVVGKKFEQNDKKITVIAEIHN
tara:strand:+ start:10798 stop:11340 length:543 start_codon:yes stop_codon:yes gene_type:complete